MSWSEQSRIQQRQRIFDYHAEAVRARPHDFHPFKVKRVAANLTQRELARAAAVGVSGVIRAEAGRPVSYNTLRRISEALS
jgi:predicted transcriptional regulator